MSFEYQQNNKKPIRGKIEKIELYSSIFDSYRHLHIYLPPSYQDNFGKRYPVVYMHFGQRLFEPKKLGGDSWLVHRTIEQLLEADLIDEIIVVGIVAVAAHVPSDYWHYASFYEEQLLRGHIYESFILQEVKPFIDSTLRTLSDRSHTAMIGSCAGATMSYNIAERNPDVFGKVAMLSPAVRSLQTNTWLYSLEMQKPQFMLWIDVGDAEGMYTQQAKELLDILLALGWVPNVDLFYYLEPNAPHRETYWGKRLANPLLLFFGKKSTAVSVELQDEGILGIGSKPLTVNPIVQYENGLRYTVLNGNYHVDQPEVLFVRQANRLTGLSPGTTGVSFSYKGVETSRNYQVVPNRPDLVQVRLRACVPEETPEVDNIYFCTLPLKRIATNLYQGKYTLPRDFALADVFACGMHNLERRQDGSPMPLRLLRPQEDTEIEYTIERWSK